METTALLKKVKIEMDKIGSDISSSEDELLTGERNYSPIERSRSPKHDVKIEKDDDQMSLSSLSSNDQKIEESKLEIPSEMELSHGISGHYNYQAHYQYPGYTGYPSSYGHSVDFRQTYPFGATQLYLTQPQYQQFNNIQQPSNYISYNYPQRKTDSQHGKEKPHMATITGVVQKITQELKQILKRDFNKKMVENTAFKKFEIWWEEESTKENKTAVKKEVEAAAPKEPAPKDNNINILLEANRENLYSNTNMDFGYGLGLRASLPKMPSFRRKKIPVHVPEDEDSRKFSDNEEIVHNSDSETRSRTSQRIRKVSLSSSSESSVFSSSSDSSSDDSSSDSEVENSAEARRRRSTTPQDRSTPIPTVEEVQASPAQEKERIKTPEPMQVDSEDNTDRPRLTSESTVEDIPVKKPVREQR